MFVFIVLRGENNMVKSDSAEGENDYKGSADDVLVLIVLNAIINEMPENQSV